jgi:hypothetical protein
MGGRRREAERNYPEPLDTNFFRYLADKFIDSVIYCKLIPRRYFFPTGLGSDSYLFRAS